MARVQSLGGYPIEQHSSPNVGGSMTGHKGVVLHIAQGSYRGTISWQNNPDQRYADGTQVTTSSTWIVGRETGEWAQMVDTARIAWCQRSGSYDWLSVELAGFAPAAPTAWQVEACAQLLAWAHRTHGIPLTVADHPGQRGLGHHAMDREGIDPEWGHDSCPGAGVIAAKAAIVARAVQINGGDDDMTPEQDRRQYNDDRINSAILAGQATVTKVLLADGKTYRDFPLPLAKQAADAATNSAAALAAVKALAARPPLELTDAHLEALADKLAARLGHGNITLTGTFTPASPQE